MVRTSATRGSAPRQPSKASYKPPAGPAKYCPDPEPLPGDPVNDLPFHTLLYRYFFFGWLFRELGDGNLFERAVAARYNREQARRWLPLYMLRWLCWALVFYLLAGIVEVALAAPGLALWCYAASAMGVAFAVMTATAWIGLSHRREWR